MLLITTVIRCLADVLKVVKSHVSHFFIHSPVYRRETRADLWTVLLHLKCKNWAWKVLCCDSGQCWRWMCSNVSLRNWSGSESDLCSCTAQRDVPPAGYPAQPPCRTASFIIILFIHLCSELLWQMNQEFVTREAGLLGRQLPEEQFETWRTPVLPSCCTPVVQTTVFPGISCLVRRRTHNYNWV